MNIFLSVNKNWSINDKQNILLKSNKKYLENLIRNKVVVYDESFLLKEASISLIKNKIKVCFSINGFENGENVFDDLAKVFEFLSFYNPDNIFVLGGYKFYKRMLPYCKKAFVTKLDLEKDKNNTIENLDQNPNWELVKTGDPYFEDGIVYYFCEYVNKNPIKFNYGYEDKDLI